MFGKKRRELTTTQMIVLGFFVAIMIGTVLLTLPISSKEGSWTNFVDSLFTSTTSICVTGLTTLNTLEHWSFFGQVVILILIQFGGLGVITFTTSILLILRKKITLKERLLIQDAYNLDTLGGMVKLTIKIIKGTFLVESIGALFYSFQFIPESDNILQGIWKSIFHSVSAFCNAGLDIVGDASFAPYRGNILINIVTMTLIVLGGIGFPVWWDVIKTFSLGWKEKWKCNEYFIKLGIHSKLAITVTGILIFGGMLVILLFEANNVKSIGGLPWWEKGMAAMFQSVTTRTAGFLTVDQTTFTDSTAFFCIMLMFIGGSPSGTAGGIKTVTFAVIILSVFSIIKGKADTEVFHRRIAEGFVKKALAVVMVYLAIMMCSTMILSVTEEKPFLDLLYEVVSALATVGLSRNLTPTLSTVGKFVIIITMYLGRVGPISMALFFNLKRAESKKVKLPEGKIIVG